MKRIGWVAWLALAACGSTSTPSSEKVGQPGAGSSRGAPSGGQGQTPAAEPGHGPSDPTLAPGKWLRVAPAEFTMSRASDSCRGKNEVEHPVSLTRAFEMTATEVTRREYRTVTGADPSKSEGCIGECPVDSTHWHMAAAYCNALSERTGASACYVCGGKDGGVRCMLAPSYASDIGGCLGYRLPTEAEWEHAFRAEDPAGPYNGRVSACTGADPGLLAASWYRVNSDTHSHPVATKLPNAWGFYDMSGNVWEWTQDRFVGDLGADAARDPMVSAGEADQYVTRGGSYNCEAHEVRGSHRSSLPSTVAGMNVGFRCARTLR